jgi:hypothetical protein
MLDIKALHVLQNSLRPQRKHQHQQMKRRQGAFIVNSGRMFTSQNYSEYHAWYAWMERYKWLWQLNANHLKKTEIFPLIIYTRNTCMQQPLAYILLTLFQHEVFVITPTLNAGSRCSRHACHGNTIFFFKFFCTKLKTANNRWNMNTFKYRT